MTNPCSIFSTRSDHIRSGQFKSGHINSGRLKSSQLEQGHFEPSDENKGLRICLRVEDGERTPVNDSILARRAFESMPSAAATREPARESLSELIQYIVRSYHDFIREEMPRLHKLSERVIVGRRWRNPELIDLVNKLRRLSGDLTFHMSHCENKVFPYIEALERSRRNGTRLAHSSKAQAESLSVEVTAGHALAGELLRQLEAATNGFTPPQDASLDMMGLYMGLKELARRRSNHIQLEGYLLFPRALALEKKVLAA